MLTEISQRAKDPFLLHDSEDLLPCIIKRNTIRWRARMSPCGSKWDLIHWLITVLVISAAHHRRVFAQPSTTELQNNSCGYLANYNSSMAVVIVFLVCAFFLMGFSSVYLRRCAESRVSGGGEGAGQTGSAPAAIARARRKQQGLDPALIEKFPILVYSAVKSLRIGKSGSLIECAVWLSEFEDCETMRLLPKCGHVFHPGCIDAWLASHVTCPVCRSKLSHDQSNETAPCSELVSEEEPNVREGSSRDIVINIDEIQMNFPPRRLPRSHSTGHDSLVRVGECTEKYTLKRCSSYDVVLPR